eukprot:4487-Pelagomonas_calceolata.AAC.4
MLTGALLKFLLDRCWIGQSSVTSPAQAPEQAAHVRSLTLSNLSIQLCKTVTSKKAIKQHLGKQSP